MGGVIPMGRLIRQMFKGAAWANPVLRSLAPGEPSRAQAVFLPFARSGKDPDGPAAA
jgi:hypothetical protein